MKVLLLGYYGHRNFGDDLLMKLSLDHLRGNANISSLAVTCEESGMDYVKGMVPYIDRVELMQKRRNYIGNYDRVIFGGGGTIFEYRSNLSISYLLKKRFTDFLEFGLARRRSGTRFASIGLGIGPFADARATQLAMNRLAGHDLIYVRDSASLEHAKAAGLEAHLSHDLSFLDFDVVDRVQQSPEKHGNKQYCFIIRNYKYGESKNRYLTSMLKVAEDLELDGGKVKWLSFQKEYDTPIINQLQAEGHEVWSWTPETMGIAEVYEAIADSACVVTARMHGTYAAGMLGIPAVSICLHPKLKFAASHFPRSISISADPSPVELYDAIKTLTSTPEASTENSRKVSIDARDDLTKMLIELDAWIAD